MVPARQAAFGLPRFLLNLDSGLLSLSRCITLLNSDANFLTNVV
jgi:hypothetical protein